MVFMRSNRKCTYGIALYVCTTRRIFYSVRSMEILKNQQKTMRLDTFPAMSIYVQLKTYA